MIEHCSAPGTPCAPGRCRDSGSKFRPGGWKRKRRNIMIQNIAQIEFIHLNRERDMG